MDISSKRAAVTGGAYGLSLATAKRLLDIGADVARLAIFIIKNNYFNTETIHIYGGIRRSPR